MKRLLSLILCLFILSTQCTAIAETESEDWFPSDDGVVKARMTSIDCSSSYPTAEIGIQFCLEGEEDDTVTPVTSSWIWDLSDKIGDVAANNPSYGNRKIPINIKQINAFKHIRGTIYEFYIDYTLGKNDEYSNRLFIPAVDLSNLWPDEFINYDTSRAAFYLKEIQKAMYNPSSLNLRKAKVYFSESTPNILYYYFEISGQVRAGGNNTSIIITKYDSESGGYVIRDDIDSDDVGSFIASNYVSDTYAESVAFDILKAYISDFPGYSVCNLNISAIYGQL